jgi:hypothetical protein
LFTILFSFCVCLEHLLCITLAVVLLCFLRALPAVLLFSAAFCLMRARLSHSVLLVPYGGHLGGEWGSSIGVISRAFRCLEQQPPRAAAATAP